MKRIFALLLPALTCIGIAGAQIPNAGFEDTVSVNGSPRPQNWSMSTFGSGVSTQAHSGQFAMEIWTWYCYAKGIGIAGTNPHGAPPMTGMPFTQPGGIPISGRPIRLRGMYRYEMGAVTGPDSALVQITMKKFNTTSQQADVVGFAEVHLPPVSAYEPFQVDIQYTSSVDPDSMVIAFVSSNTAQCDGNISCDCFYLKADDLVLDFNAGTISLEELMHTSQAYPNPAYTQVTVYYPQTHTALIRVYDARGNEIALITAPGEEQTVLDISAWPAGLYVYRLFDSAGTIQGQGKIIRQQ